MTADPVLTTGTSTYQTPALEPVWFLEIELTNACQLTCRHCYSLSSPAGPHGSMTFHDWMKVLDTASAAGIRRVQLIGGEPTMHPGFLPLAEHALRMGLEVQVFSNLYRVTPALWALYAKPGVTLATSYYSDVAELHDKVTLRPGSHRRTRAAIVEALERGIPLKVAIVQVIPGQRAEEAHAEMQRLGVPNLAPVDRMRGIGRAAEGTRSEADVSELCGQCGNGRAAISPNGDVYLCVMSRFLPPAGNVRDTPLREILNGLAWGDLVRQVPRPHHSDPKPPCAPVDECPPASDSNDCPPASTICEGNALLLPLSAIHLRKTGNP
ncbi:radical SAM protein [Nonomuraea sp. LP-02]|uniref:radical SAM/SPASM domain-containing protein n=1 Tax=Nonomuraea sp. LP-02 TaxID=3097960 RepID=UPI002E30FD43|nr:radical SAM protein [Nonomuraea sp. LP-02]MED7926639.1 radical SAM protein [Nonomuraea sp. LP-02]